MKHSVILKQFCTNKFILVYLLNVIGVSWSQYYDRFRHVKMSFSLCLQYNFNIILLTVQYTLPFPKCFCSGKLAILLYYQMPSIVSGYSCLASIVQASCCKLTDTKSNNTILPPTIQRGSSTGWNCFLLTIFKNYLNIRVLMELGHSRAGDDTE